MAERLIMGVMGAALVVAAGIGASDRTLLVFCALGLGILLWHRAIRKGNQPNE